MRSTTDIVHNVTGQSLLYRVPQGRPTAATFEVFDEAAADDGTVEFSGTATIEAVDTTTTAAAGVGQTDRTVIALTDASAVTVGRRYLLRQSGRKEWVLVVGKASNTVYASAPLQNAYTTGADFEGTHVSAAVDATWVADESNLSDAATPAPDYRVRWLLTVDGVQTVAYTFFDLVRGALGHGVTLHDVEARFWNLLDDGPVDHRADQGTRLIDAAWEDVKSDLASSQMNDAALRDAQLVDQLLVRRLRLVFAENGHRPANMPPELFLSYAQGEYQRFLEKHFLIASKVAIAAGTGSGAVKKAAPSYFRK